MENRKDDKKIYGLILAQFLRANSMKQYATFRFLSKLKISRLLLSGLFVSVCSCSLE